MLIRFMHIVVQTTVSRLVEIKQHTIDNNWLPEFTVELYS